MGEHEVSGPSRDLATEGEALLRTLPEWFGIEESIREYGRKLAELPTWSVRHGNRLSGLLAIEEHFEASAEVHVMAVAREDQGCGVGRALLDAARAHLRERGVRFLQVKTVGPSSDCPHYAGTRRFYERMGFTPLEELPDLWDPHNPCLILVQSL